MTQPGDPRQSISNQANRAMGRPEDVLARENNSKNLFKDKDAVPRYQKELQGIFEDEGNSKEPINQGQNIIQGSDEKKSAFIASGNALLQMISGNAQPNLKLAVYLSEKPVLGNYMTYKEYCSKIAHYAGICRRMLKGFRFQDDEAKNFAIQQLFKDTFKYTGKNGKLIKVAPFHYDFDDFSGLKNLKKQFVTKLLKTHSGQCHSMPLLYAILAEELNAKCFIAYSPMHSYIIFRSLDKKLYNFETTSGVYTSPIDVISSGYVTQSAIEHGIYLRPIAGKELIGSCYNDLLSNYQQLFGIDNFVRTGAETMIALYPKSIRAYLIKGNCINDSFKRLYRDLGKPKYADLNKHPDLKNRVDSIKSINDQIDELGYAEIPDEAYQKWLKIINEKLQKQKRKTTKN